MNKKSLIAFCTLLILYCIFSSIAYYNKTVTGSLIGVAGKAVFNVTGFTDINETKSIVLKEGKIIPGDKGSFELVLDATESDVDMYASLKIVKTALPENLKFYTSSDYKSELHTYYSYLQKGSETLTIYWYWNPYIDDDSDNEFINSNNVENLDATITISAHQVIAGVDMKNGASAKTEFWQDAYRNNIETISFEKSISGVPNSCTEDNLCWDISYSSSQSRKVYAYLVNSTSAGLYNLHIASDASIFAPSDCSDMFSAFSSLVTIDFNDNFNTSNVTTMSSMFKDDSSLVSLDLNIFNTKNVNNMGNMFYGCSSLSTLYLNNFNTSNVTSMANMFLQCSLLENLDLSSFNTSKVTNMVSTFSGCSSLEALDLSSFNTSNVTNMHYMFQSCSSLEALDLNIFNTSSVTNMSNMFYNCSLLKKIDLSSFNTSNVTNMASMFYNCKLLENLNLDNFNTLNVTNMSSMFSYCLSLTTEINIINANVSSYDEMFTSVATNEGALITVNYIADASDLVDSMIATKSDNSNVVKGNVIS